MPSPSLSGTVARSISLDHATSMCFWKKQPSPGPCGQRTSESGRFFRSGRIHSATPSPSGVIAIPDLHEQPQVLLARLRVAHAHERPAPLELAALELELEPAAAKGGDRRLLGNPAALVPDVDVPRAIF